METFRKRKLKIMNKYLHFFNSKPLNPQSGSCYFDASCNQLKMFDARNKTWSIVTTNPLTHLNIKSTKCPNCGAIYSSPIVKCDYCNYGPN